MNGAVLKPCPFCGRSAKTFGPYGWYRQWGISHSCETFYNGADTMCQGFGTEAGAIAAWNTRQAFTGDLVEALRTALNGVLDSSGARGTFHALKHADAVVAAERLLGDGCECGVGDQSEIGHFHEPWCPALAKARGQ